ncbi:hypothetical protein PENSPDRAFT_90540 [Peniophora sp. CONT]|nr:hypothetical protein PENSPDRAFT_90540 [Peniophora sp. CONT]
MRHNIPLNTACRGGIASRLIVTRSRRPRRAHAGHPLTTRRRTEGAIISAAVFSLSSSHSAYCRVWNIVPSYVSHRYLEHRFDAMRPSCSWNPCLFREICQCLIGDEIQEMINRRRYGSCFRLLHD